MYKILVSAALAAIAYVLVNGPASAQTDIGRAEVVENRVEGRIAEAPRQLQIGNPVFEDERIRSHAASSATFRFNDNSTLAIGASSDVVLDRFVYNPRRGTGDVLINATKGAFRFVTGNASSDSYRVATPSAFLGTRGTDFDFYVDRHGNTFVIGRGGRIFSCPRPRGITTELRRDDPRCCDLNTERYDRPIYAVIMRGASSCVGPRVWNGQNPFTHLSRRLFRQRDRLDTPDRNDPPDDPQPPSQQPDPDPPDPDPEYQD